MEWVLNLEFQTALRKVSTTFRFYYAGYILHIVDLLCGWKCKFERP